MDFSVTTSPFATLPGGKDHLQAVLSSYAQMPKIAMKTTASWCAPYFACVDFHAELTRNFHLKLTHPLA
jgi:hypothetical protein